MPNTDWIELRTKLSYNRLWAMYDQEIHDFLASLSTSHCTNRTSSLRPEFYATFHKWLLSSRLNRISGVDAFPHRDMIVGVTQLLDDTHLMSDRQIVVVEGEYPYHERIKPTIKKRSVETLATGDHLILSLPFAGRGDLHRDTDLLLDRCLELDIPVTIDGAWYGCTRGIEFHFDHPAIQSIGFSLSKSLCMGSDRVGVRYSRNRTNGPITILNDYDMGIDTLMGCAIACMKRFPIDFLQDKYGDHYRRACENLELTPTKSIHVAWGARPARRNGPIGMRQVLLSLQQESYP